MAEFKQIRGEVKIENHLAPASTAFAFNDVVTLNSSGQLALATAATPRQEILGLIQKTIASTDSDYASTKEVPVLIPHDNAEFEAPVESGTPTASYEGKTVSLESEDGLDVDDTRQACFKIRHFISSTVVRGQFVKSQPKARLVSYQETVSYSQFTDGGGASGTYTLNTTIPDGAVFERCLVTNITGFTGDTSATLVVGDGTDTDRYNTGTPSVFTTDAGGVSMGAPSGTVWHTADVNPVLTVTSATDFTLVTAGSLVITLFWWQAN